MSKSLENRIVYYRRLLENYKKLSHNDLVKFTSRLQSNENDSHARTRLVESQLVLIAYLTIRFANYYGQTAYVDDLFQDASIHLFQKIHKYSPERGDLKKWAQRVIARYLGRRCKPDNQTYKERMTSQLESIEKHQAKYKESSDTVSDEWEKDIIGQNISGERAEMLLAVLCKALDADEFRALVQSAYGGSMEDLAKKTGKSPATWYRIYAVARDKSQAILGFMESLELISVRRKRQ